MTRCAALALAVLLSGATAIAATTSDQEHVHQMAHEVMPFDISRTLHIFRMTERGGVQQVVIRNKDASDQVVLIQQHLQHEAENFRKGDYSDPAHLHGAAMPGVKELEQGARHVKVSYAPLSNGGQITFDTSDVHLLTAVHRWFGAQLSEHGADAKAE
jgi:hypothetical protein